MDNLNEFEDPINSVLLLAAMGMNDDAIMESLEEDGLDKETSEFVFKTAIIIIEEGNKYVEEISDILSNDDLEGDGSKEVTTLLLDKGVSEKLISFIYIYIVFMATKGNAEMIIENGQENGKTEEEMKSEIMAASGMDSETTDTIYLVALAALGQVDVNEATKKSSPLKMFGRAFFWLIIGILDFQVEEDGYTFGYIAVALGIILFIYAVYRTADS